MCVANRAQRPIRIPGVSSRGNFIAWQGAVVATGLSQCLCVAINCKSGSRVSGIPTSSPCTTQSYKMFHAREPPCFSANPHNEPGWVDERGICMQSLRLSTSGKEHKQHSKEQTAWRFETARGAFVGSVLESWQCTPGYMWLSMAAPGHSPLWACVWSRGWLCKSVSAKHIEFQLLLQRASGVCSVA